MADERPNLSGVWLSRYEYSDGLHSEHVVELIQNGAEVKGSSRPDPTGSKLSFDLEVSGETVFGGKWEEKTSPSGNYKGQVFNGWVGFVLKGATRAEGIWIGPNSDVSKINSGQWTLEKQTDEDS